jgi:intracellular sulfur oxidation DsrE/DsrF family protein
MMKRSVFLASSAAALALASAPVQAQTPVLGEDAFRRRLGTAAKHREVIVASRVDDGAVLQYAVNALNGFEMGWGEGPNAAAIALILGGSAAVIGLDDAAWTTYRFPDLIRTYANDFIVADGTRGNPFARANPDALPAADRAVPALLKRGVKIFVCNTALGDLSRRLVSQGQAKDWEALRNALRAHVLPGLDVVPAGVAALGVAQEAGYNYVSASL